MARCKQVEGGRFTRRCMVAGASMKGGAGKLAGTSLKM